jgi:hypothetical protein
MSQMSPVTETLRAELSHAICRPNDTQGVVTLSKQLEAVVAIFERHVHAQRQLDPETVAKIFAFIWHGDAGEWRGFLSKAEAFVTFPFESVADTSTDRSPVMQAADKAAKVVEGWSDAKREYAGRVTDSSPDREGK